MKFFTRWKRVFLAVQFLFVGIFVLPAVAQTLSMDQPLENKALEIGIKLLFPALWTYLGPVVGKAGTSAMLALFGRAPASARVAIVTVISGLIGMLTGFIDQFPLHPESAAEIAGASGAAGQVLASRNPERFEPKPAQTGG